MFLLDVIVSPFVLLFYPPITAILGVLLAVLIIIFVLIKRRK